MTDYKKMYYELFNAITDSMETLRKAQLATEEIFMSSVDELPQENESENSVQT